MELFISRYSNKRVGQLDRERLLLPIGITRGLPRFKIDYQIMHNERALAPTQHTFGIDDKDAFWPEMLKDLQNVSADAMFRKFQGLARSYNREDVVLLCFEDVREPGNWCHRQVVAHWFHEQLAIDVVELDNPDLPRVGRNKTTRGGPGEPGTPLQPSLFDSVRNLVNLVPTSGDADLVYAVRIARAGHLYCHCWGYITRKHCRHLDITIDMISKLEAEGAA